jgi:hypothetical protein
LEVDWQFLEEIEIWRSSVRSQDLQTDHVRYDTVRLGYWVRVPSTTATILALKGCKFRQKIAQTNRLKSARPIVSEIRKISKSLGLKPGWYQLPDDQLKGILENYLSSRNVLNRGNRNE